MTLSAMEQNENLKGNRPSGRREGSIWVTSRSRWGRKLCKYGLEGWPRQRQRQAQRPWGGRSGREARQLEGSESRGKGSRGEVGDVMDRGRMWVLSGLMGHREDLGFHCFWAEQWPIWHIWQAHCGSVAEDRLNEGQGGSGTQHQILPFKLDGKIINAIRYWFRISGDGILIE